MLAKRDVAEAFRWIWVREEDAGLFATEMPGAELGLEGMLVAVFLVLFFAWLGSPGEYMAFGWGIQKFHEAFRPGWPEWHDEPAFHCDFLMDDDILVEPLLGIRPWISAAALEEGAKKIFGPLAINADKKEEEGAFSVEHLIWASLSTQRGSR